MGRTNFGIVRQLPLNLFNRARGFLPIVRTTVLYRAPYRTKLGTIGRKRSLYPDPLSGARKRTGPVVIDRPLDGHLRHKLPTRIDLRTLIFPSREPYKHMPISWIISMVSVLPFLRVWDTYIQSIPRPWSWQSR